MKISNLYKLNLDDAGKAAILTGIVSVLGSIIKSISEIATNGHLPSGPEFSAALSTGLLAGIGYLAKNYITSAPKTLEIDPNQTTIVDTHTKEIIQPSAQLTENNQTKVFGSDDKIALYKVVEPVSQYSKPEELPVFNTNS